MPSFVNTLVHLLRRDGLSFFSKCARYAFSPSAWAWLVGNSADERLIASSPWFDAEWFLREYPKARRSGMTPAYYYLLHGNSGTCSPGPDFIGEEYLALNLDVKWAHLNPLLHFERLGRKRHRQISCLENPAHEFPEGAREFRRDFAGKPVCHRRTAVFAAFSVTGRIPETDILYLKGLAEVADNVVYVASNPVFPEEADKLRDLVRTAIFLDHGEYDFGSYKRGYAVAKELGLLRPEKADDLILANSSCYGPVVPFQGTFDAMADRPCDFWGLTAYNGFEREHIQSYFLVFRRKVLDGGELETFLDGVRREINRWHVIFQYETRLTGFLREAGYRAATLVPWDFYLAKGKGWVFPPTRPVTLLEKYGMPLVKAKTIDGENDEGHSRLMAAIQAANPALAQALDRPPALPDHSRVREARLSHTRRLEEVARRVRAKALAGKRLDVLFLVSDASMFPAKPLFDAMLADEAFSPRVLVVPDLRWPDVPARMEACRNDLSAVVPGDRLKIAEERGWGIWQDEAGAADIVCYASPYDISTFVYNPHWAVGRSFLPIHVNYGFFRSLYDHNVMERQNYAYFWKAFFECGATEKEYAEHSILKGANADVVGYVKMDALAAAEPWSRNGDRKRVLVAPHHSVEGGTNDTLALSNFQRYADYFLALPVRHPELDFVFRPHPFLFTVLSRPDKWGKARVDGWISRMKAHPNVRWSDEGDYFPAFASCDAIVQDCGSYLVEWFYTGKPCCYMLKDPSDIAAKFAPLGRECLSHCHIAYAEADIEAFLRDVVEGGVDAKAAGREAFRQSVMLNYPHAADAALASIKRALGMT
jgi:hypothetical protein